MVRLLYMLLGFGASLLVVDSLSAEGSCGYVATTACPGCVATNPGGCSCGPKAATQECWCVKSGGAVQDGVLVECFSGAFSYVSDPHGNAISEGSAQICSQNKKCKLDSGDQYNCAKWTNNNCPQGGGSGPACDWRLEGTPNSQPTYVAGAACDGGEGPE